MQDKDAHVRAHRQPQPVRRNVNGGNDSVRYFVSGDVDNETGPIQMPGFEVARFDSRSIDVRDEWLSPAGRAAR